MSDWQRFLDAVEVAGLTHHQKCVLVGEAHRVVEGANREFNRWFRQATKFQEERDDLRARLEAAGMEWEEVCRQRDEAIRERDELKQHCDRSDQLSLEFMRERDEAFAKLAAAAEELNQREADIYERDAGLGAARQHLARIERFCRDHPISPAYKVLPLLPKKVER